jgi:hypothetical protein
MGLLAALYNEVGHEQKREKKPMHKKDRKKQQENRRAQNKTILSMTQQKHYVHNPTRKSCSIVHQ